MKGNRLIVSWLALLFSVAAWAEELPMAVVDSISPDPEWYVAPVDPATLRAPMRSAAASCKTDSILTFNIDSVLTEVTAYAYDDAGHTISEIVWTVNADGSRVGKSKKEDLYEGNTQVMTSTYIWDNTISDWIGSAKTEYEFTNGKNTATTVFDWLNGAWSAASKQTYVYDAAGRETQYTTYARNAAGQLEYGQRREKTYNTAGKLILDIQYGSYTNGAWVGSYKYVYDYNAAGTQTLYEYYSSYSNGAWVGSTRNVYEYDAAGNKIREEKYSGMTGSVWKGSSKYTATFNAAKKEIEHITYKWKNSAWVENLKTTKEYDGSNITDEASYTWSNGWVGSSRTSKTFSGTTVMSETKWVWSGGTWVYKSQLINTYQSSLLIESKTNSWRNGAWQDSLRTTHGFDAKKIDTLAISSAWNGTAWIPTDSTIRLVTYTVVAGKSLVQEDVTTTWSLSTHAWKGVSRKTNEYDQWGNVSQSDTYTWVNNTGWVNNVRRFYAYKDGNKNLEILNAYMTWDNTKKLWKGSTKTEKGYDETNRLIKNSTYKWNTTRNNWEGLTSTEDVYVNNIKVTSYSYKWDATIWNWIGMFKHDYTYQGSKIIDQIDWRYNTTTGWYYDTRVTNTYDSKGRNIQTVNYQWITADSQWCMTSKSQITYDADTDGGRLREQLTATGSNCVVTSYALQHYMYACDSHFYTIRFVNEDGSLLDSKQEISGNVPSYTGVTPTKQEDAQYTYTFNGWDKEISAVTGNTTYTATFSATKKTYTITFKNGNEVLQSTAVEYGTVPTYNGATPTKQGDAQNTYTFVGWDKELVSVTGEETYVAVFSSNTNSYTITWLNDDNSLIDETTVAYGVVPTHDNATKLNTAEWTYTFTGWDKTPTVVTGEATYKATFSATKNSYLVTFKDEDGATLDSKLWQYGATPSCTEPTKQNNAQYTFTFAGWDKEIASVTAEATYTATYSSTVNTYLITFKNGDETLQSTAVEYGATPSYNGATPYKDAGAQYTYTYAGWDKTIAAVTGDATYTATFTETLRSYTITWLNSDNSPIDQTIVEYGVVPTHADATKANTAEYTYTFTGWDVTPTAVTGDATYKATFSATKNSYTVTFKNGEQVLQSTAVEYGEMPNYVGESPTKQGDAENTYTFNGWDKEITSVTGEETYTAIFIGNVNSYLVTFKDEDGATLDSKLWLYGATPSCTEPTKQNNAQYTFTFAGWDKEIISVTAEATYTATYSSTVNTYLITFKNGDETLQSTAVEYGATPAYSGATPIKTADAQYTYTYAGWDKEIASVTGEATYVAIFDNTINSYSITWLNDDNSLIEQTMVEYGIVPTHDNVTKQNTAEWTYTFTGWDTTPIAVTDDATYKATFSASKNSYTITFKNGEQVLQSTAVEYGEMPNYNGITPTKPADAQYTYTFVGWDATLSAVTGEATYTAVFDSALNSYTVTFYYEDGTTVLDQMTLAYGETPSTPYIPSMPSDVHHTYTFSGWSPEIAPVTGDVSYTPTFTAIPNQYTVIFKNYNGRELLRKKVDYGTMPEYDGDEPVRPATNQCTYTFDGWTPELELVSGDATYTAVYVKVMNTYTILFYDEDGTLLDEVVVEHGQKPTTSVIPTKEPDEQYIYTFAGWTPKVTKATTDATYTATYTATKRTEDVPMTNDESPTVKKVMIDGVFYILRGGHTYTIDGILVK